ncbi:hypothetical protein [Pelovirga terrestris]|uniref:Uncharacterized protein n=1 Tax=Pelovirga terrestris TaxID=2771352 RepID=A0A8J6QLC5_9BACT|nr:hypothetical protein [Pelovirga terrestris]MBD1399202.1 hypothetical protein [Pelovirga terrestris]
MRWVPFTLDLAVVLGSGFAGVPAGMVVELTVSLATFSGVRGVRTPAGALALIANPAAGRGNKSLDHQAGLAVGSNSLVRFHRILAEILKLWC